MYGKIVIYCDLKVKTGLHIGASGAFSAIGAVDSPVIRDPLTGKPILPGSSLKGKLRTLLARSLCREMNRMPDFNQDAPIILRLFGSATPVRRSRLQFSDSFISNADALGEAGLTEVKTENAIRRTDSVANPRQIERVVAGACFSVRIVYDIMRSEEITEDMQQLVRAMQLLQLDYLGGHGSRGSGRVGLDNFRFGCIETDFSEEVLKSLFKKAENYELLPV